VFGLQNSQAVTVDLLFATPIEPLIVELRVNETGAADPPRLLL
jgi:hypothetical protein